MTTLIRGLYEAYLRRQCRSDVVGSGFWLSGIFGGSTRPGVSWKYPSTANYDML